MKKQLLFILATSCLAFNSVAMRFIIHKNNGVSPHKKEIIVIHVAGAQIKERKDPKIQKLIGAAELAGAGACYFIAKYLAPKAITAVQDLGGYWYKTTSNWDEVSKRIPHLIGCIASAGAAIYLGCDARQRFKR